VCSVGLQHATLELVQANSEPLLCKQPTDAMLQTSSACEYDPAAATGSGSAHAPLEAWGEPRAWRPRAACWTQRVLMQCDLSWWNSKRCRRGGEPLLSATRAVEPASLPLLQPPTESNARVYMQGQLSDGTGHRRTAVPRGLQPTGRLVCQLLLLYSSSASSNGCPRSSSYAEWGVKVRCEVSVIVKWQAECTVTVCIRQQVSYTSG
jgi:hypothetical protein